MISSMKNEQPMKKYKHFKSIFASYYVTQKNVDPLTTETE